MLQKFVFTTMLANEIQISKRQKPSNTYHSFTIHPYIQELLSICFIQEPELFSVVKNQ